VGSFEFRLHNVPVSAVVTSGRKIRPPRYPDEAFSVQHFDRRRGFHCDVVLGPNHRGVDDALSQLVGDDGLACAIAAGF